MMMITRKRRQKERRVKAGAVLVTGVLLLTLCGTIPLTIRTQEWNRRISYRICAIMLQQFVPNLTVGVPEVILEDTESSYETRTESVLSYDTILARDTVPDEAPSTDFQDVSVAAAISEEYPVADAAVTASSPAPQVQISREKLNDYDYLIQNFYTVDRTTTISSAQLNASELLSENLNITERTDDEPQILIYHTHGSEDFVDSVEGDYSTTVIGVGEYLTQILENTYGYHVYHDTGVYDTDRDRAYSVAEPYVQQILADHPSIEVVIDLHRDAVGENTRLVTEQNGKQMAKVMFFNGLSRTTAMGDITYLPNPYIQDNLAFSLQMQIAARELYPDFTRNIYLKGYRYNMHFRPKSLLVEVGAQTNTLEEAKNAMEPLAVLLHSVLSSDDAASDSQG